MGARAQVLIEDTGVYLYTHWGSGSIIEDVRDALNSEAGRARQNDPEYLGRIIFDVMKDGETDVETGFGIGTKAHTDLDFAPIAINCSNRSIRVKGILYSFEDFIEQFGK